MRVLFVKFDTGSSENREWVSDDLLSNEKARLKGSEAGFAKTFVLLLNLAAFDFNADFFDIGQDAGLDDFDAYTQRAEIVENQLGDVFRQ